MAMTMKENIVVLYANPYSMDDKERGGKMEGVSVAYLIGTSLSPITKQDGSLGQRPAKGSVRFDRWDKFPRAPAVYEGHFEASIGGDGKATLKLVDVDFLTTIELVSTENLPASSTAPVTHASSDKADGGKK